MPRIAVLARVARCSLHPHRFLRQSGVRGLRRKPPVQAKLLNLHRMKDFRPGLGTVHTWGGRPQVGKPSARHSSGRFATDGCQPPRPPTLRGHSVGSMKARRRCAASRKRSDRFAPMIQAGHFVQCTGLNLGGAIYGFMHFRGNRCRESRLQNPELDLIRSCSEGEGHYGVR